MKKADVRRILGEALDDLRVQDTHLFANGVAERAVAHRLAVYLERRIDAATDVKIWNVDCEYNRNGSEGKWLRIWQDRAEIAQRSEAEPGSEDGSLVFPDIVVHKRGADGMNLLVIEIKTAAQCRDASCDDDRYKLALYVQSFHYENAAFIDLRPKKRPEGPWNDVAEFVHGG